MEKSAPSFVLNLDVDTALKPLPYVRKGSAKKPRMSFLEQYPSYEEAFFTTVNDCAKRIETLKSSDLKHKYNDELTRIFARRDFKSVMRLFTELIRVKLGEPSDVPTTTSTKH